MRSSFRNYKRTNQELKTHFSYMFLKPHRIAYERRKLIVLFYNVPLISEFS